jgi:tRNA(Ile)-lysidine synthase
MTNPKEILKKYIYGNETVIIGVSGGPDSVYLTQICLEFAREENVRPVIAHVNHKLRGKESDKDELYVRNLAKKNGLAFELLKLGKIRKGNVEEESRIARYAFFEKLRKKYGAGWILTAHQRDDNVETVLFNLVRGSFLNGLKGMEEADENRHLLRPLINMDKKEILASLKKRKIKYRIDKSNSDTKFSRNLLRQKVIPLLRKINPNFSDTFCGNLENIREAVDFFNGESAKWFTRNRKENGIPLVKFLELPETMQKFILADLYSQTHGDIKKFNRNHLEQILAVIRKKQSGKKKEFGDNHFIAIEKNPGNHGYVEKNLKIIKIKPCQ